MLQAYIRFIILISLLITVVVNAQQWNGNCNLSSDLFSLRWSPPTDRIETCNSVASDTVHKPKTAGIVTGSLFAASGAALCITGQILSHRYYDKYKKSAFTENTDILREKVTQFTILKYFGAGLGGIGLVVIVFSF